MVINISVTNKHLVVQGAPIIVCGNSGYSIKFTFDAEWSGHTSKFARFVYRGPGGIRAAIDVPFNGTTVVVPILTNIREVEVGVYAGDLRTTTPARIPCERSILCGNPVEGIAPETLETAMKQMEEAKNEHLDTIADFGTIDGVAAGDALTLMDADGTRLRGLTIYGKTTQNGTPTPQAPVVLESAGAESGSITISIEGEEPQTLSLATPNGLPGIPVDDGGNYMDENGQQWVCDEVDFVRGKRIQRVGTYTTNADTEWKPNNTMNNYITTNNIHLFFGISDMTRDVRGTLCDRFPFARGTYGRAENTGANIQSNILNQRNVLVDVDRKVWPDIETWTAWVVENPLTFQYILETPVETDLTAEELAAYAKLRTNKPLTVLHNDAGAYMAVSYSADTKNYIDNQIQHHGNWTDEECLTAFMQEANAKAAGLGMTGSEFNVPAGLPIKGSDGKYIDNTSTAEDLMKLGLACFGSETLTEIMAARTYTFRTKGGSNREATVNSLYHTSSVASRLGARGYHLFGGKGGSLGPTYDVQGDYGILNSFCLCSVGTRQAAVAILGQWLYDAAGKKQSVWYIVADILDYIYAALEGQNPEDIAIGEYLSEAINRADYPISVAACLVPIGNVAAWSHYSKTALLAEPTSYSVRPHAANSPASVTKLLTALVTVNLVSNLDELVTIHESDKVGGSGQEIYAGEVMSFRDLLYLSLLESNNDATHALARAVGEKLLLTGAQITYNPDTEYIMKPAPVMNTAALPGWEGGSY